MSDNEQPEPSSAPETSPPPATNPEVAVDLSVLKTISFGPDWSATPSAAALARKMGGRGVGKPGDRGEGPRGRDGGFSPGGPPRRDRRPARPSSSPPAPGAKVENGANVLTTEAAPERPRYSNGQPGGTRPPLRRDTRSAFGERRHSPPPFRPTHEALFYPDDAAFRALLKAIRASCRTYELFEVAQLILQKPERFVVVIKALPQGEGPPALIHVAQPDHLPFESEDEAVAHVFDKHLDKFLLAEEIDVEPPKGNFLGVSRCGFTGELLGPPNYHRYPQLLREHHARKLPRVPFDKFSARVELVKEPEQLAAWLEKMKKTTRYRLKTPAEGAPEFFETLEAARTFILAHQKDAVVRAMDTARYPGRLLEQFLPGNIRRSVETILEQQRRFPLDTANNLRGRLRRMKFNLYKKGAKGVSYVCAVKRRFRDAQTVLAEHVQKLIGFIEQHPLIPVSRLAHEFLGLPLPPENKVPESPVSRPGRPAATGSVEQGGGDSVAEVSAPVAGEVPADTENPPPAATDAPSAPVEAAGPPPTARSAKPESHLTPEQQLQLRELVINLRWLVTEGYVVEYGDGRLFAPAPLPAPKPKLAGETAAAATPAEAGAAAVPAAAEEDLVEETPPPFPLPAEDGETVLVDDADVAEFADDLDQAEESPPSESAP